MRIIEIKDINKIRFLLNEHDFVSGHYCYNIDLIEKLICMPYKLINFYKKRGKVSFFIVIENDVPLIIAPLFKRNKEIFILGGRSGFDFTDLFFSRNCDIEILRSALLYLFEYFKNNGYCKINWQFLAEDSISYKLLKNIGINPLEEIENIRISFNNYDFYLSSLRKSVRQNLRTAENRLLRDNLRYELLNNIEYPLPRSIVKKCVSIYSDRQKEKYKKNILNRLMIKTINFQTQMMFEQKGIFFVLIVDGEVSAFMFGYQCEDRLEIPKLAINSSYNFYSPGMVLINKTIEYLSNETIIRYLDLCRGNEKYKFRMGGEVHKTFNYEIKLS